MSDLEFVEPSMLCLLHLVLQARDPIALVSLVSLIVDTLTSVARSCGGGGGKKFLTFFSNCLFPCFDNVIYCLEKVRFCLLTQPIRLEGQLTEARSDGNPAEIAGIGEVGEGRKYCRLQFLRLFFTFEWEDFEIVIECCVSYDVLDIDICE